MNKAISLDIHASDAYPLNEPYDGNGVPHERLCPSTTVFLLGEVAAALQISEQAVLDLLRSGRMQSSVTLPGRTKTLQPVFNFWDVLEGMLTLTLERALHGRMGIIRELCIIDELAEDYNSLRRPQHLPSFIQIWFSRFFCNFPELAFIAADEGGKDGYSGGEDLCRCLREAVSSLLKATQTI